MEYFLCYLRYWGYYDDDTGQTKYFYLGKDLLTLFYLSPLILMISRHPFIKLCSWMIAFLKIGIFILPQLLITSWNSHQLTLSEPEPGTEKKNDKKLEMRNELISKKFLTEAIEMAIEKAANKMEGSDTTQKRTTRTNQSCC